MNPASSTCDSSAERHKFVVSDDDVGCRIDVFLRRRFPQRSRASLQQLIHQGNVAKNADLCKPADTLRRDDVVHVTIPSVPPTGALPWELDLDILFEDDQMIVVNKPPALVVHPTRGHRQDTLVNALLAYDPTAFNAMMGGEQRPGIVHRLDKDTSGVLVVARTPEAWQTLKEAFAQRRVEKTYLAVVVGSMQVKSGRFENPIGRHPVDRKKMTIVREGGKPAVTLYRVLGTANDLSLVEVRILTGRTHQIRVHFACAQHPVLADSLYGGRQRDAAVTAPRQMLHAWKLAVEHPLHGGMDEYIAPLPEDFRTVLREAGLPEIAPLRYPPNASCET